MISHIPQIFIISYEILIEIRMDNITVMVTLVNQVAYVAVHVACGNIIRHLNILRMNSGTDPGTFRIDDLSGRICYAAVFQAFAAFYYNENSSALQGCFFVCSGKRRLI